MSGSSSQPGSAPVFKLSAVLEGHTGDVRAVLLPDPSFAITASRDGSTRVWKRTSESPPLYDSMESSHGAQFKTCLAYVPPSKEFADGLILSSGQDALIEARQPALTADVNADAIMVGHANQVCSLDVCASSNYFVSGSWDSTAKVWEVGRWEAAVELHGHTATVWAVLAYSRDTIVTGCADRAIRVFDLRGKLLRSWDGKDIVRALAKLPKDHPSGAEIVSATNDGVIRLWTLRGELIAELFGHESYIYSLSVLPSGDIISSGEDRSVRVWQGTNCVQVITLPALSVWSVSVGQNGDIIVGSSDKMARIFTRESERLADAEGLAAFEESLSASSIPTQQMGDFNMTDLPGEDFLQRKSGTKEGQSQIIKAADGSKVLYQWSMSQNAWIAIGQVVDSSGASSGNKPTHNMKQYDYVFDIDIEDGKPPLKLPFNVTQNPYDAATKFLQDHELPMSYLEETANFIIKNTQGVTLGPSQGQQQQPAGADPWGTEQRYRPGEPPTSSYRAPPQASAQKSLPQKQYLAIVMGKPSAALGQIVKRNNEYSDPYEKLSVAELESLTSLSQQLEKYNFQAKPSLPTSPALKSGVEALLKVVTQWQPPSNRLAGLDLLRFIAVAAYDFPDIVYLGHDAVGNVLGSGIFDPDFIRSNNKPAMVAARFLSNALYGSPGARAMVQIHIDDIIARAKPLKSPAASDTAVAIALSTLYMNLAVVLTTDKTADADTYASYGLELLEELTALLKSCPAVDHSANANPSAQSTEPAYRALVALGTVIVGLDRDDLNNAAKEILGVPGLLNDLKAKKYLEEPRFRQVAMELIEALR
ncbi:uncharacterized protein A1O9_02009 [Exophiala aquamarina CBS 119918]|uniref:Phospholipase A-2-activating protein n=1 Tax=Exophiala aquamarina CBS 119918 TaxID=1182545 RepID=A0A072PM84_9EURO|nr:uncharacterized protein A1O9_02009 [Exophiala aquamarina CBS 119918]KEF60448.1 hypothetical protein A1O9_02009 [Exophiala aquamarina CBS 119918]